MAITRKPHCLSVCLPSSIVTHREVTFLFFFSFSFFFLFFRSYSLQHSQHSTDGELVHVYIQISRPNSIMPSICTNIVSMASSTWLPADGTVKVIRGFVGYLWLRRIPSTQIVHGPGIEPQERQENFLLQGQLSVLALISVSVPPPCYCSSTWKTPVIPPKVQVAGYS